MMTTPRFALVALLCALAFACHPKPKTPPPPPPPAPAEVDQSLWAGLSRMDAQALRAAMMRGQIEAARRLISEDSGEAASAHIDRVVSEFYAPAKADYALKNLSLDVMEFKKASDAARGETDRGEMYRKLDDLTRRIEKLAPPDRQWSKPGTVKRVLQEIAHQYGEGVQSGFVVNEERYQDAFGLALVAQEIIDDAIDDGVAKDRSRTPELKREAEGLVNMFPSASAPKSPADAGSMLAQISRVEMAFPGME